MVPGQSMYKTLQLQKLSISSLEATHRGKKPCVPFFVKRIILNKGSRPQGIDSLMDGFSEVFFCCVPVCFLFLFWFWVRDLSCFLVGSLLVLRGLFPVLDDLFASKQLM